VVIGPFDVAEEQSDVRLQPGLHKLVTFTKPFAVAEGDSLLALGIGEALYRRNGVRGRRRIAQVAPFEVSQTDRTRGVGEFDRALGAFQVRLRNGTVWYLIEVQVLNLGAINE